MKLFFSFLSIALFSISVFAVEVQEARFNAETNSIEVDVVYGGGCKEHTFTLKPGICLESFPVQCQVTIIDQTKGDFCEAFISQTVVFPLNKTPFKDEYFNGASLSISGPHQKDSTAVIQLPFIDKN